MASRSGFSHTAPSALSTEKSSAAAVASGQAAPPAPAQVDRSDFQLVGSIGAQLAGPLATMQQIVQEFAHTRKITRSQMTQLTLAIDTSRQVAMQAQQIARLAGGRLRQSHERLSLHEIINDALTSRAGIFQALGVELYRNIKPVEVIVDPGLCSSLVDAAIDWAAAHGRRIVVSLEIKNWPEHGMFFIKVGQTVASGGASASSNANVEGGESDSLGWHLMEQIAVAMGVSVDRVSSTEESILMIEFPRTVKQLEGLTAVEVDAGGDSQLSESKPLAGHRVLVISLDEGLRNDLKVICRNMGLVMDSVPSTQQAVRYCELDVPHLIIIDERAKDPIFDELREDLQKTEANFPFIEIASKANVVEMASWMSNSMTRVSRDALKSQLPSILVFELAKVI